MTGLVMTQWLTYKAAARRVHRSIKTIKRYRRHGMPMTFDPEGRRIVDEEVLLAWWRGRLLADPIHQARMRARQKETPVTTKDDVDVEELPGRSDWRADIEPAGAE